ncbi:hypothetical protein [Streptomyces sp. NPDC017991]|uniref:hypothetical protein n=1 Tax=Streptomyces sp. NPDC017991 TaxID=3365026 RepID=UPI0037A206EF
MNVLSCAACGRRLTEPVQRLDEPPEYPGWDGLPDEEGRRPGPATVPRGTYVPHPLDVVELAFRPDTARWGNCCGATPYNGVNRVRSCGRPEAAL